MVLAGMIKRPPHYEITHDPDADGWYLVYQDWDACHGRRFATYAEALALRARWELEDIEAMEED